MEISGEPYDSNTLPSPSNTNRTEPYSEVMILSNIVEEIMNGNSQSVVTYSNDGSSLNSRVILCFSYLTSMECKECCQR